MSEFQYKLTEQLAKYILEKLIDNGHSAYFVGGYVRDQLYNNFYNNKLITDPLTPSTVDIDIATSAEPHEVEDIFKNEYSINTVGKSFLVTIVDGIEVATFRRDLYHNKNEFSVKKGINIEIDLSRRDLTINAIAMDIDGNIIDPFDGIEDIKNRTIKFVGDPKKRIYEDPNRIIRACRFLAKLNGKLDINTKSSLIEAATETNIVGMHIAKERIQYEIIKSMNYGNRSGLFFRTLHDIGLLVKLIPELVDCIGVDGGPWHNEDVFDHCIYTGDSLSSNNPLLKLAGYLHDVGKPKTRTFDSDGNPHFINHDIEGEILIRNILKRFKFSTKDRKYICNLIKHHMFNIEEAKVTSVRRFLNRLYEDNVSFSDFMRLHLADRKGNLRLPNYSLNEIRYNMLYKRNKALENNSAIDLKSLTIDGLDVMYVLEIPPSKEIGKILKELFDYILEHPEDNNRDTLISILKKQKGRIK